MRLSIFVYTHYYYYYYYYYTALTHHKSNCRRMIGYFDNDQRNYIYIVPQKRCCRTMARMLSNFNQFKKILLPLERELA